MAMVEDLMFDLVYLANTVPITKKALSRARFVSRYKNAIYLYSLGI